MHAFNGFARLLPDYLSGERDMRKVVAEHSKKILRPKKSTSWIFSKNNKNVKQMRVVR